MKREDRDLWMSLILIVVMVLIVMLVVVMKEDEPLELGLFALEKSTKNTHVYVGVTSGMPLYIPKAMLPCEKPPSMITVTIKVTDNG